MNLLSLSMMSEATIDYVGPTTSALQDPVIAARVNNALSRPLQKQDAVYGILRLAASSLSGMFSEFAVRSSMRYDLVFVESTRCSFVFDMLRPRIHSVCCAHNVECDYARTNRKGYRQAVVPLFRRSERRSLRAAEHVLVMHSQHLARYSELYGSDWCKSYTIHPVCSPSPVTAPLPWNQRKKTVVISGSLDIPYNEISIRCFLEQAWETLSASGYSLIIAGRKPGPSLKEKVKQYRGVTLIANPANMHDILSEAMLMVVPDMYGDGMKLRIAEAMSYGLPVAATSRAILGYKQTEKYSVIDDSLLRLGEKIEEILRNPEKLESMSLCSREVWQEAYTLEVFSKRLMTVIRTLLDRRVPSEI